MTTRLTVTVLLTLCLSQCIYGQLKDQNEEVITVNSSRFAMGPVRCSCSPSNRGYRNETMNLLRSGVADVKREVREIDIFDFQATSSKVAGTVDKTMRDCFKRDGVEACINADEVLRKEGTFYCTYDRKTGKNLHFRNLTKDTIIITVASCDTNNETLSSSEKLSEHSKVTITPRPKHRNQGCVAVEHLDGHALQHKRHLNRSVLCSDGFCATPDHAIIVNGEWTSMKLLCNKNGDWNCTEDMKLVNNLKIYSHRRVRYNRHIVITPYDIRFPRIAIWIIQTLEDIVDLIIQAISLGIAIILGLLMYNAAENFVAEGEEEEENNDESDALEPASNATSKQTPKSFKQQARAFLKQCGVTPKGKSSSGVFTDGSTSTKKEVKPPVQIKAPTSGSSAANQKKKEDASVLSKTISVPSKAGPSKAVPSVSGEREPIGPSINISKPDPVESVPSKSVRVPSALETKNSPAAKAPATSIGSFEKTKGTTKEPEQSKPKPTESKKEKPATNDLD